MKYNIDEISSHYDTLAEIYNSTYGDTIQSCRPIRLEELHNRVIHLTGMNNSSVVLDAGCGVCGPAIHYANHTSAQIHAITISQKQIEIASDLIKKHKTKGKIELIKGDFNQLEKYYKPKQFNIAVFNESLGHSPDPDKLITTLTSLLNDGAIVYIKDYFINETVTPDVEGIENVVNEINKNYKYHTMKLNNLISSLRKNNFVLKIISNPDYEKNWQVVFDFETKAGINSWGNYPVNAQSECFELVFQKR